jgi:hypothetical protein
MIKKLFAVSLVIILIPVVAILCALGSICVFSLSLVAFSKAIYLILSAGKPPEPNY